MCRSSAPFDYPSSLRRGKKQLRKDLLEKINSPTDDIPLFRPAGACHKCGGKHWVSQPEPYTWSCVYCGNRAYYTHGVLQQQIDILMTSGRKGEFVRSEDGTTIRAKRNEEIRRLYLRDNKPSKKTRSASRKRKP
ncbi:MAG: hypothetical protein LHW56_01735 [Candidatus Cloacimonetes bacterium]|nr:hypothetical protein [Candidatus Cloacimonadota bacterium]MDY0171609.1 hypothetical protein [Candidatus Cloacimonadaceae bacterium]